MNHIIEEQNIVLNYSIYDLEFLYNTVIAIRLCISFSSIFNFLILVSNRIVLDDPVVVMDTSILGERSNIDMKIDEKEIQRRIAMTVLYLNHIIEEQNIVLNYSIHDLEFLYNTVIAIRR